MPDNTNHLRPIFYQTFIRRFLLILVICIGSNYKALTQEYFQQEVNFRIQVTLDDKHHELYAYETVEYINNSPDTLHFIYFHLWPNGYSANNTELAKQLFNSQGKQLLFNDPELRGYIDSLNFTVNNRPVFWDLLPGQPDICRIVPEKPIYPGDTLKIATPFHVKIPKGVTSRLGHIGESYQISQWYPKPAVYDKNGWHQMSYQDQGEFYSEFGNFDVSITLPANYIVGSSGNLQNEGEKLRMERLAVDTTWMTEKMPKTDEFPSSAIETKTLRYTQNKIHDFAWFADKRFHLLEGKVTLPNSGRKVTTWVMFTNHQAELWKNAIHYVNNSIEKFSAWNGDYPYQSFIAVQSSLSAGSGMEYPGMTVVGNAKDAYSLDEVIAHEVAHSWFYSALGSNERRYPFMDEGITSANEVRYMRDSYPQKKLWETFTDKLKLAKFFHIENMPVTLVPELEWLSQARDNLEQPLDLGASDYTTLNYSLMIYNKAGMSFNYLRAYLGDSVYDSAMKAYYKEWKFKHPQPDDLKKVFEMETGKDLTWFFTDLLGTIKRLDYKAVLLEDRRLLVKNSGELVSPVVISGMTGDSVFFKKWVDGFEGQKWIEIPAGDYTEIKIDPHHQMPELFRLNNNIRKSGIFPKSDPLQSQMYLSLEDPEKRYLMFIPALNWTRENGIMIGAAFHNGFLTPKPFEYFVMPFYAFNNSALAGFGKIAWNITPYNKMIRMARISVEGSQFGAPGNQDYHYIKAGSEFFFRSVQMNNLLTQKASANFIAASDLSQIELLEKASMKYYLQFGYQLQKTGFINPFLFSTSLETNHSYLKTTAEMNYKLSYRGKKNGLDIRLFAGAMLQNSSNIPFYALAAGARNGHELYMYQGAYPDRFAVYASSFFSRQMTVNEGGLVSPVNEKLGFGNWLVSLSLTSTLPGNVSRLPVKPFVNLLVNDHGPGNGHDSPFFFEAGLKAGVWNFFEIYVPILVSSNIESITGQFKSRIRLVFNLDSFGQAKLNSGMGIRIH
jgi:hypothetical protein